MIRRMNFKIFLTTLTILICFTIMIGGVCYYYFDQMYEKNKIDSIIEQMNLMAEEQSKMSLSEEEMRQMANVFMREQNAFMTIYIYNDPLFDVLGEFDESSDLVVSDTDELLEVEGEQDMVYEDFYFITLNTDDGDYYDVYLSEESYDAVYGDEVIANGQYIGISGAVDFNNYVIPVYVDGMEVTEEVPLDAELTFVEGFVSDIYYSGNYISPYDDYSMEEYTKDDVTYVITLLPGTSIHQIDFYKTVNLNGTESMDMYVNVSLQSMAELTDFVKDFLPYLLTIIIVLSLLISYIFSRYISKPIVQLTETATRMAGFDFNIRSVTNRHDEIGELSESLNILSSNLGRQEKVRKEFVANVSHELKSPLGVIRSYSEAVRDNVKVEKREKYIETILKEVDAMDGLIQEMLELSKYEADAFTIDKSYCNLEPAIKYLYERQHNKINDKNLTIQLNGSFEHDDVDRDKILRVLRNLIDNAVQYAEKNSVIWIYGIKLREHLRIEITNKCKALPDESLEKLWDRFYTVEESHNRERTGTGLGLSICKAILEKHGCKYGVIREEDNITFWFEL